MSSPDLSVGSFLRFGMENAKRHFFKFFGMVIVMGGVCIAGFGAIVLAAKHGLFPGPEWVSIGLCVACIAVIYAVVWFLFFKNIINMWRGEKMVFIKVNPVAVANFAIACVLMCIAILAGCIALIIPGIIIGLTLMHAPYLIADRGIGVFEAFKESAKLSKGHKIDIFIGLLLCGLILFVLLLIITIPLNFIPLPFSIDIDASNITTLLAAPVMAFINVYPYLALTGQIEKAQDAAVEAAIKADAENADSAEDA